MDSNATSVTDEVDTGTAAALIASLRIFGTLPASAQLALASQSRWRSSDDGGVLQTTEDLAGHWALIVCGAVDLTCLDQGWSASLQTGESFGAGVTPVHLQPLLQATGSGATKLLMIPADAMESLCDQHPAVALFLPAFARDTLPTPLAESFPRHMEPPEFSLLSTPAHTLVKRQPVMLPPDASIREAAQLMRDQRVSSVLLVDQGHLLGLVTDRDLRNRVIAAGLGTARPLTDIATLAPVTVPAGSAAFEALLSMTRHNVHHLPVMDGQRLVGMLTATDLTQQHTTSPVYLVGDIQRQPGIEGLVRVSKRIRLLQQHLAAADASAYSTGHMITAITDALTSRLIALAEATLGPAPVDYVWVAAGSQARSEQTAKSDQDNCLILDDTYNAELHGEYFAAFSRYVCDGLDACGYIHCPGEMMAMTDTWRQPQERWLDYFYGWIQAPDPKALMLTCVFFDLRAIHGKTELLASLRQKVLKQTRGNSLFLAYMVSNALKHRPPLGIFGTISQTRSSGNALTIDLKHTGMVPLVDLARIYALAGGLETVNSHDRLEQAGMAGEVSAQGAHDLRDTLEFLGKMRIAHQARQIGRSELPDNLLSLKELSNFEISQLKDAFRVVQTMQEVLGQRYHSGRF